MEKEVTIYDIAKRLRLSAATVSRALNDHPGINRGTKQLIASTARELGYRSNPFASNLRRRRTNTLGVIVPRLNSSFMSAVLAGMEKVANEASYNLIISQSLESVRKEAANVKTMFDSRVDGLLVSLAYDTETFDHFDLFLERGIPLLFFDRVMLQTPGASVVIDNQQAGYEATRHLIQQGCRRIGHVTGNLKRNVYADRLLGYRRALLEHGLAYDESAVLVTDLSREAGLTVARQLQSRTHQFDGLFVTNDLCAVSCLGALKTAGWSIPADLATVGFNDDPVAQVVEPALTTIHYPGQEMGERAVQCLLDHLDGRTDLRTRQRVVLRSELVVRASSMRTENS